jgi:hypothetical protein
MSVTWPAPPGIRPDVHERFLAVIQRATERERLSNEVFAPDDDAGPEAAGNAAEEIGGERPVGYGESA